MKQTRARDGHLLKRGDLVAVYTRLSALGYTAWRPQDSPRCVVGVTRIEKMDGHAAKCENGGWWQGRKLIHLTRAQYRKWVKRHEGATWIDDEIARKEAGCG